MTQVLYWDIDGTLLTTARAGVFALEEAAMEVCGAKPDLATLPTAGLTDGRIAAVIIERAGGSPEPELVDAFLRAYERHLPERLGWRAGRVLPGVEAVLEELAPRDDVVSLLLTGNTAAGATAKLRHYGLDRFFAEGEGAFCASSDDRETIARRARDLARERVGEAFDPDRTYVIGDTPHDIRCGKAIGARTVAVATGPVSADELRRAEPWLLLDRLPEPDAFCSALGLGRG
jgi:phosphoglycolate phosphatase-like HAD superfamily hydrolase